MTLIDKYTLDRLKGRGIRISFDCPYCQGARLELKEPDVAAMEGIRCFKCKALILLDGLSLTVVREASRRAEG